MEETQTAVQGRFKKIRKKETNEKAITEQVED